MESLDELRRDCEILYVVKVGKNPSSFGVGLSSNTLHASIFMAVGEN
jgi:hypothetical protein